MAASLNNAVRKLLDEPNYAVLGTVNSDGSPQTSLVWVGRDGNDVVISTAAGRRKDRNIRRDPRVSLSVWDRDDPEVYAEVRGLAAVTEDVGRELAVRLAEKYNGPGGGEEFLQLPPDVVRVVVRITPQHAAGNAAGGAPRVGSLLLRSPGRVFADDDATRAGGSGHEDAAGRADQL